MAKKIKKTDTSDSFDKYTLPTHQKDEEAENPDSVNGDTVTDTFWSGKGKLWMGIILFYLVLAMISGVYIFNNIAGRQNTTQDNQISTTTVQEIPSPSSQPAEPDRTTLKIEILNGGGVAGSAASAKSFLENLGYKDIAVGNADNYGFKTTLVETKVNKKNYDDMLIKDLSSKYKAEILPTFLKETNEFDVVITIGAK